MRIGPLQEQLTRLDASHPGAPQRAMAIVDSPRPMNSQVFLRGNSNRLREEVPRQFLATLAGDKRQLFTHGSGSDLRHKKLDPDNHLLAKANRQQLDFESTWDTLLFVVGSLDSPFGGRPVDLRITTAQRDATTGSPWTTCY
jgi:hypothetical protein